MTNQAAVIKEVDDPTEIPYPYKIDVFRIYEVVKDSPCNAVDHIATAYDEYTARRIVYALNQARNNENFFCFHSGLQWETSLPGNHLRADYILDLANEIFFG